ncbi:hypothetical protein BJ508DRAFT_306523 [Ascobolus immersus RN42]|uniref:Uncharacterized protein n=1 Tax=Ascobolus immersus RN42 TaxID=1160509 RepID=A0A3N4I7M9_ASCIM|nr:hypothetical protein BJ508DRAFT_306523 [Ascobolus immersus RN42]
MSRESTSNNFLKNIAHELTLLDLCHGHRDTYTRPRYQPVAQIIHTHDYGDVITLSYTDSGRNVFKRRLAQAEQSTSINLSLSTEQYALEIYHGHEKYRWKTHLPLRSSEYKKHNPSPYHDTGKELARTLTINRLPKPYVASQEAMGDKNEYGKRARHEESCPSHGQNYESAGALRIRKYRRNTRSFTRSSVQQTSSITTLEFTATPAALRSKEHEESDHGHHKKRYNNFTYQKVQLGTRSYVHMLSSVQQTSSIATEDAETTYFVPYIHHIQSQLEP